MNNNQSYQSWSLLPDLLIAIRSKNFAEIIKILEKRSLTRREISLGLLDAVQRNYLEAVSLLLEAGAEVNYRFGVGTALTEAIYLESDQIVLKLLENGADVSIPESQSNYSPLLLAISEGKLSMVKLLVKYGADVNEIRDDQFALLYASIEGYEYIANYLEPLTSDYLRLKVKSNYSKDFL